MTAARTPKQRCPHCHQRAAVRQRTNATQRGLRHLWLCGGCESTFISYDEPAGEKAAVEKRTVGRLCDDMGKLAAQIKAVMA